MNGKNKNKLLGKEHDICKLFKQGISCYVIAKKFNVTHNPIINVLKKHNLWKERRIKQCNKMKPVDIAYLAGLIDGEGCIYASVGKIQKNGTPSIRLLLQIQMTDKNIINWICNTTGVGKVKKGNTPTGDDSWHWTLSMREAYPVLYKLVKFLKLKKIEATLAMQLIELRRKTCRTVNFNIDEQIKIVKEIKQLKFRYRKQQPLTSLDCLEIENGIKSRSMERGG